MKKMLVVLGLLLLVSAVASSAQTSQASYFVDYFSNNINPLAADQVSRAINVGTFGTPLTSIGQGPGGWPGQGDICENIYVFDNNQEMVACCACRLTPNELSSAAVGAQLTNHALTGTAPVAGVVKIAFTLPSNYNGPTGCRAETAVLGGVVTGHVPRHERAWLSHASRLGSGVRHAPAGRTAGLNHQPVCYGDGKTAAVPEWV